MFFNMSRSGFITSDQSSVNSLEWGSEIRSSAFVELLHNSVKTSILVARMVSRPCKYLFYSMQIFVLSVGHFKGLNIYNTIKSNTDSTKDSLANK